MSDSLLLAALGKLVVSVHEILDDDHHLYDKFPLFFLYFACILKLGRILVKGFPALCLCPCESLFVFRFVVDTLGHAADDFNLVNGLNSHAEIFLDEA